MKHVTKNFILLALVVGLIIIPLYVNKEADFGGADGKAEEMITAINPDYTPWSEPLWEPSGETESLLFALQAALGAGFLGYYFGLKKGRKAVKS